MSDVPHRTAALVVVVVSTEEAPVSVPDEVVLEYLARYKKYNLTDVKSICDWCEWRERGERTLVPDLCEDCARELGLLW